MEFAYRKCNKCGTEFGTAKPGEETVCSKPYDDPFGRYVSCVAPCPSCGEDVPLWQPGEAEANPKPKPKAKKKS